MAARAIHNATVVRWVESKWQFLQLRFWDEFPSKRILMKYNSLIASMALLLGVAGNVATSDAADLKITFVYDSDKLPENAPVDLGKDQWCVDAHPDTKVLENKLMVNPSNKGIKNIVIFPDSRNSNIDAKDVPDELMQKAKETAVIDNVKCVFEPHIFAAVAGGKITVKNSDQTGHNASFSFFANDAANQIIPQGGQVQFDVKKAERAPVPVMCNIHPWMVAYVVVSETPFVGVSNDNGELLIQGLPEGKEITLKVWHENQNGSIAKVNLDGKDIEWKKGAIEVTLKAGLNDLGVCKLKPDHFK